MTLDLRRLMVALILVLALPASYRAGGGDDHDHGTAKPVDAPTGGLHVASASSDRFEVVLKIPAGPTGKPVTARLFLSDAESNVPIAGATVTVEIPDLEIKVIASPEKDAGIYVFDLIAGKAGHYDALITLEPAGAGDPDLLPLSALELGPAADAPHGHVWRWIAAGGLLLVALALAALWARAWRRRRPDADLALTARTSTRESVKDTL